LIIDEENDIKLFRYDNEEDFPTRFAACSRFLEVLSERLDNKEQAQWIHNHFPDETEGKDMEQHLNSFFSELKAHDFPLTMLSLIKCCNQEIPFGAITMMKSSIGTNYPFKDLRGTWRLSIIFRDGIVHVNHQKIEQSVDEDPDKGFVFEWRLSLRFTPDLTTFVPILHITDFEFGSGMSADVKRVLLNTFSPILSTITPYYRMWKKTLTNSNDLQRDMSQFANKVMITNENGNRLWCPDKSKTENENVRDLVAFVGNILGESSTYIEEFLKAINSKTLNKTAFSEPVRRREKYRPPTNGAAQMLLSKDMNFSKLWCVLKCLSSDMHHPALMKMRERLYETVPFKDVRKSWTVHLQLSRRVPITIIHRKLEESPNGDYYFEWILVITLKKDVSTIEKVDFRINDYGFNDSTTFETKQLVKNSLKQFYQPRDDIHIALDLETTLKTIIDR